MIRKWRNQKEIPTQLPELNLKYENVHKAQTAQIFDSKTQNN